MLPTVVVVADYAGTLVVSDRQDVRPRWTKQTGAVGPGAAQVAPGATTFGIDFANRPYALAEATDRHWNLRLEFGPSLTLTDVTEQSFADAFQVLYAGALGVAWHSREVRLSLTENASYGRINSSYLFQPGVATTTTTPGQPAPPTTTGQMATPATLPQAVPAPVTINFLSSSTLLRADARTGLFTSFYVSAAFNISGGIDTPVLPQQFGPRFEAGFTYQASRRDAFVTLASAQGTFFTTQPCVDPVSGIQSPTTGPFCKPEVDILQLTEGMRHTIDRATNVEVDVGASAVRSRILQTTPVAQFIEAQADSSQWKFYPAGLATLTHVYPGRERLTFHADVSYQPVTDYRSGFTNDRVQGDISLADSLARRVRMTVTARAAQTVPADQPLATTLAGGEADLDVALAKTVELTLGASMQWQNQVPYGAFFSIFGFLAVTAATPALRF